MMRASDARFDVFYAQYVGAVRRTVAAILKNPSDVEDVVQEVFLQAWTGADRFNPARGSTAAWLTVIARTRAIDRLRGRARTGRSADIAARASSAPDGFVALMLAERADALRSGFSRLESAQQDLLSLAFHDGVSHSRIAQLLGIPVGTIKTRIRAALAKLRSHVDRPGAAALESAPPSPVALPFTVAVSSDRGPVALTLLDLDDSTQRALRDLEVVVVDDDEETLKLLVAVLSRYQVRASAHASARDALAAMAGSWPGFLLADLDMPGDDGYALLAEARAEARVRGVTLPAAAFTGRCSEQERSRALLAGFDAYLTKPVHPLAVLSTVASLASRHG